MDTKEAGRRGGKSRAKKLSKERRSEIARMGGKARHAIQQSASQ
jgi:general stress protein YciG